MSFPGAEVARGVGAVELEAADFVEAGVHEGDAEGPAAAELGVGVLVVAQVLHEFLHVEGFPVGVEVALALESAVVNQEVGVGHNTGDGDDDVVVHLVELARLSGGHEELGHFFLLCCKYHAYVFV